jgi:predicted RNA-binding Zn-ribbon protein involved in translation (DUF1610 family)
MMLFKRKEKKAKEAPKGKQRVLRCPQCGSSDLYYENALVTGYKYHCKKCDYIGALVLEEDYDVDEVLEDKEGD